MLQQQQAPKQSLHTPAIQQLTKEQKQAIIQTFDDMRYSLDVYVKDALKDNSEPMLKIGLGKEYAECFKAILEAGRRINILRNSAAARLQ